MGLPSNLYQQLQELRESLESSIIGQPEAIDEVMGALERYQTGLHDGRRPIGSFLFLGPTGTGKTFCVQTLAKLIQPTDAFIKIDCSEYSLEQEVAKLLGSPPGYVGHEAGSPFAKAVKAVKKPEGGMIILLDEIEKAHPRFFDTWLQVLDDGVMTDSKGVKLDFSKSLIFLTSNVGAKNYSSDKDLGFRSTKTTTQDIKNAVTTELRSTFRPEFLNRLTATVFFQPLTKEQQDKIFWNLISEINSRLSRHYIKMSIGNKLYRYLTSKGFSKEYGARELRRVLVKELERPLASMLIKDIIPEDSMITIDLDEANKLQVKVTGEFPVLQEER